MLSSAAAGDPDARAEVIQAAYDELRSIAGASMARERQDHTLSATALVNEVSLRLLGDSNVPVTSRARFFAYASKAMRNLLIDHARTRGRQKRGGGRKVCFDDAMVACAEQRDEFLALDEALSGLALLDPQKAQVVEMKYFAGMTNQEVATALGVSVATVKRNWAVAQAWLRRRIEGETDR